MRIVHACSLVTILTLPCVGVGAQQKTPDPVSTGPGCWEWHYDPAQPIPADAKVVPGTCPTPDGRCYVVPTSTVSSIPQTAVRARPAVEHRL